MRARTVFAAVCLGGALLHSVAAPSTARAQALSPELRSQIEQWYRRAVERTGDGAWGVAIGAMDGRVLWSASAELPLIPASTAKVFTTGFARERVGGEARKRTRIVGIGHLDPDGSWRGAWSLEVGGDPTLERPGRSGPTLTELARGLAARGVRRLDGPLVLTSALGRPGASYPSTWSERYTGKLYAPPVGPVTLHENTISFTLRPGRHVGEAPSVVSAFPAGVETLVHNGARTVAGRRSRLSLIALPDGGWQLRGTVGIAARSAGISAVAHDPTAVLAAAWGAALERAGIRWERRTPLPAPQPGGRTVLAEVWSAPLDSLASEVNRRSLNIGAELLLQWGAGNQTDGPRLLTQHVRQVVGPAARVELVDGSGLSEGNRVSPLTQMLYLARMPQRAAAFPLLLPANGTGTLRNLRQGVGRGVVHAKTGTIDHVATVTGYLGRPDGVLVLSLMFNGRRTHAAREAQWELFRLLGADGVAMTEALETQFGGPVADGN